MKRLNIFTSSTISSCSSSSDYYHCHRFAGRNNRMSLIYSSSLKEEKKNSTTARCKSDKENNNNNIRSSSFFFSSLLLIEMKSLLGLYLSIISTHHWVLDFSEHAWDIWQTINFQYNLSASSFAERNSFSLETRWGFSC